MAFSDLVEMLSEEYRKDAPGSAIRMILVASSDIIKLGSQSASQPQYGGREAPLIFPTLDDALAFCRAEIAAQTWQFIRF